MSQRGSIRKRGATWTAYYFTTEDGKRKQHAKAHRTKAEAQAFLTAELDKVNKGTWSESADKTMTVETFLTNHWLPSIRTEATRAGTPRRASTMAGYEIAVRSWIVPHIGNERLLRLTPATVEQWLATLRERGGKGGRPVSGRSAQVAYTVLRAGLEHALRRGYVQRNVASQVGRPGAIHREMSAWSGEEVQAFVKAAAGDRLYAAWVLLLTRGLRRGELCGLKWSEVDLDAGWLRVVHTRVSIGGKAVSSTPKTEAGRRSVPLDAALVAVLRTHRKAQTEERLAAGEVWSDSGYVFTVEDGSPYHPESVSQRFERLCRRSGTRTIRLHDLRHTAATLMLEDGTPVKVAAAMLGHANANVTLATYAHVVPGATESAGERLSGRVLGGGL